MGSLKRRMILWGILYLVVGVLIPVFCVLPTYLELTQELAFFDYLLCVDEYLDVNTYLQTACVWLIIYTIAMLWLLRGFINPVDDHIGITLQQFRVMTLKSLGLYAVFAVLPVAFCILLGTRGALGVLICGLVPFLAVTVVSVFPNIYYVRRSHMACPRCGVYSSAMGHLTGSRTTTTYTTTTTREKVGEVHTPDYTYRADVYGDVTRTEKDVSTTYTYDFQYRCENCGAGFGQQIRTENGHGRYYSD